MIRNPGGSGGASLSGLTANTAVYANTTTSVASASTTKTELQLLSGKTSLGNQPLIVSQSLGAQYNIVSHTIANTGLALSITTTRANELVLITFNGFISEDSGGAHTPELFIQLDSDTSILMCDHTIVASYHANFSFSYWLTVASAGAHTVQLRAMNLENTSAQASIPTTAVFASAQW